MPIYEFEGKSYDISTTDKNEAKDKILKHLGRGKGALESSAMDKFGDELLDRGKAAVGGVDAVASMMSKLPGMAVGGLKGLGDLMLTGDINKANEGLRQVTEGRLHPSLQGLKGYEPFTHYGNVGVEAMQAGRDATGDLGGDSPALRTLNELAWDVGTGILPLGPRARVPVDAARIRDQAAALRSIEQAKRNQPEPPPPPPPGQMSFPDSVMDTSQMVDPRELMQRAQERFDQDAPYRASQDAIVEQQTDMFRQTEGQFPGLGRSAEMQRQAEGVPYEQVVPGTKDTFVGPRQPSKFEPTPESPPHMDPFRQGDMDFPFKQEMLEFDPYFGTLKAEFDRHLADYQRNMHNKDQADALGTTPEYAKKSKQARDRIDQKAATALEKANEALANANKVWQEASEYYKKRTGELDITKPDHYSGQLWEGAKGVEKTERPALGSSGPKGPGTRGIQKTPVYRTGKAGRRQGGSVDFSSPPAERGRRLRELDALIKKNQKAIEALEKAGERSTSAEALNRRLEKLYYEQMRYQNEIVRLTDPNHPLNAGKFRQAGAVDFPGFMKQVLDKDPVDRDMLKKLVDKNYASLGDVQSVHDLLDMEIRRAQRENDRFVTMPAGLISNNPAPIPFHEAILLRKDLKELTKELRNRTARSARIERNANKDYDYARPKFVPRKYAGSVDFRQNPEYLKFKDQLPEPMKKDAKALWKEMKKQDKAGPPAVIEAADTLAVADDIPGLKTWKDLVSPITKSKEEIKATALMEPDLGADMFAKIGRQLVSGAKILGLGTENTLVRWVAQQTDVVMRESQRAIERLILDKDTGFRPKWEALSKEEQGRLWAELSTREGVETLSREQLFDLGLNEKQVDAADFLRKALDEVYARLDAARTAAGKGPFQRRSGYIPSRFRGDFTVHIRDTDGKLVHIIGANTKREVQKISEVMQESHPDLVFSDPKHEPLHRFKDASDAQMGYQAFLDILRDEDPRVDQLESIYQDYLNRQAYEALGTKKHFMNKSGVKGGEGFKEWADGYTNAQEGIRSIMNYMDHALKWAEVQTNLKEVRSLLKDADVQKAQPTTTAWAQAYMDQALGRSPKMARALDTLFDTFAESTGIGQSLALKTVREVKYWMTAMYLGYGNAGFSLSQIVQVLQTQPAWMQALAARGAEASVLNAYARGNLDAIQGFWFDRNAMTTLGKEAWSYAKDYGIVAPKLLDDARSWKDHWGNTKSAMDWIATKNMTYFEEMARTQAYLTWVHFLHETGGFKMGKELYEAAGRMTDTTMVDYRMHERPMLYKQLGIIGEAANALTTFKHNYFSQAWALRQVGKGADQRFITDARTGRNVPVREAKGLRGPTKGVKQKGAGMSPEATFYATLLALGGAISIPMRDDIDGVLKALGAPPGWSSRELILKAPDLVAFGGASTITGWDLSSKFSAANVIPDDALTAAFPFGGTLIDAGKSVWQVAKEPSQTNAMRLAKTLTPSSIKWIVEKYFKQGDMQLDSRSLEGTYRRDNSDWMARGYALRSLKESKAMHDVRTNKESEKYFSDKRSQILDKAKTVTLEGKLGPMYQPLWQRMAQDFVKNEGDVGAFVDGVVGNMEERHKDQMTRMILRSVNNPQKMRRMQGNGGVRG